MTDNQDEPLGQEPEAVPPVVPASVDEITITAGMTRRELRELRARVAAHEVARAAGRDTASVEQAPAEEAAVEGDVPDVRPSAGPQAPAAPELSVDPAPPVSPESTADSTAVLDAAELDRALTAPVVPAPVPPAVTPSDSAEDDAVRATDDAAAGADGETRRDDEASAADLSGYAASPRYPGQTGTAPFGSFSDSAAEGDGGAGTGAPEWLPTGGPAVEDAPVDGGPVPAAPADLARDDVAPGWHEAEPRGRRTLWIVIGAVVIVAALAAAVWLWLGRDDDGTSEPTPTPTATQELSALQQRLPAEVVGGQYSDQGETGVTYRLSPDGWVATPVPPTGALESLVGVFAGGEQSVTLTASTFDTAEQAGQIAAEHAATLGEPIETGVVFPTTGLGTYWTFNDDGLVTMVWHDGADGVYTVISESAQDALGFYSGLEF